MKDRPKGDLVEQLIFEAYKDKNIKGAGYFKKLIQANYGFKVSSDLYTKIINYQVKTYGITLNYCDRGSYDKYFYLKSFKNRRKQRELVDRKYYEKAFIERIYNEKAKRKEVSERKISK